MTAIIAAEKRIFKFNHKEYEASLEAAWQLSTAKDATGEV